MANLIQSIGYSLGKVHTGMINYLCGLYREGNTEPLESFLKSMNIPIPANPVPRREWNSVDLAILEKDVDGREIPRILIEVKVDDHESGSDQKTFQTIRYASQWPECQAYLFITLGIGEYYHAPRSDRFTWIRIRDFKKALKTIKTRDRIINDWADEIEREIKFQENVLRADKSRAYEYRGGTWNIYLLGQLAEKLKPRFVNTNSNVDLTCYTYGPRPDTILNFGDAQESLYMEINYNGRLNLKVTLDTSKSKESIRNTVEQEICRCKSMSFKTPPTFYEGGKIGGSKTIASFDVGLSYKDGILECQSPIEVVQENIFTIVDTFYGKKATPQK